MQQSYKHHDCKSSILQGHALVFPPQSYEEVLGEHHTARSSETLIRNSHQSVYEMNTFRDGSCKRTRRTAWVENMMVTNSFGLLYTTSVGRPWRQLHSRRKCQKHIPKYTFSPPLLGYIDPYSCRLTQHARDEKREGKCDRLTTQMNKPAKETTAAMTQVSMAAPGLPTPRRTNAGTEKMPLPANERVTIGHGSGWSGHVHHDLPMIRPICCLSRVV